MAVIQMSERELSRLRVMIDLADGRLTVEAAGVLMGVGRRQVFRLCRAFAASGASGLVSRKRGRPSTRLASRRPQVQIGGTKPLIPNTILRSVAAMPSAKGHPLSARVSPRSNRRS
jgi:hypothetical protein